VKILIFPFLATLLLNSCATAGPKFKKIETANGEVSPIYIYRNKIPCLYLSGFYVQVDGNPIGKFRNNGYFSVIAKPGNHLITVSEANYSKVNIENGTFLGVRKVVAEAGTPLYVKYDVTCKGGMIASFNPDTDLQIVDEARGLRELEGTSSAAGKAIDLTQ
jgi:hypothetical protein